MIQIFSCLQFLCENNSETAAARLISEDLINKVLYTSSHLSSKILEYYIDRDYDISRFLFYFKF